MCNYTWPDFILTSVTCFSQQVSFVQYSDDAKTEFKLNAYQDKGIIMSATNLIRYRGGNTKTGSITRHSRQRWRARTSEAAVFNDRFSLLNRSGTETYVWQGLFSGKRNEEKRPQGGRGHHWRTLPGRGEEERCQAAARRYQTCSTLHHRAKSYQLLPLTLQTC